MSSTQTTLTGTLSRQRTEDITSLWVLTKLSKLYLLREAFFIKILPRELAGIYPLLEVDDMVKFKKPDWKCVFTYVQSFYRRFRDGRSPPPKPIATSSTSQQAPLSEVALACLASQEAEKKGKEIARQMPTTKAAPIDASQQKVKKQTELSKDKNETKTAEDVKTTEELPTKEEVGRKKKNKARPAPLKDLALIRQEDDFQASQSPTQQSHLKEEQSSMAEVKCEDKEDNKEAEEEEEKESLRPKMPSQAPPPPVGL